MLFRLPKHILCLLIILLVYLSFPFSASSQTGKVWENLGLYGGQIYDIAIDPSTPDKMFAGSYLGDGLFLSQNGGANWLPVETENEPEREGTFKNHANRAIAIAPSNPQIIWVAHDYWVEKSTDGGQTWIHIKNRDMQTDCIGCTVNEDFRFCQEIAIDPHNPDIVYVGAGGPRGSSDNGAIYKTEDGGQTWTKLTNFFDDITKESIPEFYGPILSIEIDANCVPGDGNCNIWVATQGSNNVWDGYMFRSNDEGDSWIVRTHITTMWLDMKLQPHTTGDPSQIFIATAVGIYRHARAADANATIVPGSEAWVLGGWWGLENNIRTIVFDPQNPQTVYAAWRSPIAWGGDGIDKVGRSTDGGNTWETYVTNQLFFALAVRPDNPEVLFGGHLNLGVFKSTDHGQSWTPVNDGLSAVIVNDTAVDPNDSNHLLVGTISGVYEKIGSGPWSRLLENDTRSILFHPTESKTFYAGIEGNLAKTIDGGLNWTFTNIPDYFSYNNISQIAIDLANPDIMFVSVDYFGNGGAVHKSGDGGATFTKVLDGINTSNENVPMNSVAIDPQNPQRVFAGSGLFSAPGNVGDLWQSIDGGVSWTRTSLQNVIVNALLIDPGDSAIMYAGCGYSGGTEVPVYKSTDGGATWTASYNGIPAPTNWNAVTDLEFHRANTNIVYASTNLAGVYLSPNQGGKWLNLGTPAYTVYAVSPASLFAATNGGLLQCTGTCVIAGEVMQEKSQKAIHNAMIFTDSGVRTISVDGEYMMVCPAGIHTVAAVADGHANETMENILCFGADVSWVDVAMESGVSDPSLTFDGNNNSLSGKGGYCCIDSAAY